MNGGVDQDSMNEEETSGEAFQLNAEDFAPAPPPKPTFLSKMPPGNKLLPVAVFYFLAVAASIVHWRVPTWSEYLPVSQQSAFHRHEFWRLVTALFVHSDLVHLLSNTPLLIIFGWLLYGFFGALAFPIAAIAVGTLANALTVAFYPPEVWLIGASGMVYGMVGMWLTFYVALEKAYSVPMRIVRAVGFILVLLFPTTFEPTTSYLAHTFGFVLGVVAALVILLFKWRTFTFPRSSL
ncbi:MAG: rhomboid family intramembrane serine protease [Oligoflexales bacterium]